MRPVERIGAGMDRSKRRCVGSDATIGVKILSYITECRIRTAPRSPLPARQQKPGPQVAGWSGPDIPGPAQVDRPADPNPPFDRWPFIRAGGEKTEERCAGLATPPRRPEYPAIAADWCGLQGRRTQPPTSADRSYIHPSRMAAAKARRRLPAPDACCFGCYGRLPALSLPRPDTRFAFSGWLRQFPPRRNGLTSRTSVRAIHIALVRLFSGRQAPYLADSLRLMREPGFAAWYQVKATITASS